MNDQNCTTVFIRVCLCVYFFSESPGSFPRLGSVTSKG